MITVTKKDPKEPVESLLRRFSRKVAQSGALAEVKSKQRFEKPISKTERRKQAIVRRERKADKFKKIRLGQR